MYPACTNRESLKATLKGFDMMLNAIKNWFGRAVTWIRDLCGTSQKTNSVCNNVLIPKPEISTNDPADTNQSSNRRKKLPIQPRTKYGNGNIPAETMKYFAIPNPSGNPNYYKKDISGARNSLPLQEKKPATTEGSGTPTTETAAFTPPNETCAATGSKGKSDSIVDQSLFPRTTTPPIPLKALDENGEILHSSSFEKASGTPPIKLLGDTKFFENFYVLINYCDQVLKGDRTPENLASVQKFLGCLPEKTGNEKLDKIVNILKNASLGMSKLKIEQWNYKSIKESIEDAKCLHIQFATEYAKTI